MTKMVRSASNGKRFALQMSLEIKSIDKRYIQIRHLEKGEKELHLKFSSEVPKTREIWM